MYSNNFKKNNLFKNLSKKIEQLYEQRLLDKDFIIAGLTKRVNEFG